MMRPAGMKTAGRRWAPPDGGSDEEPECAPLRGAGSSGGTVAAPGDRSAARRFQKTGKAAARRRARASGGGFMRVRPALIASDAGIRAGPSPFAPRVESIHRVWCVRLALEAASPAESSLLGAQAAGMLSGSSSIRASHDAWLRVPRGISPRALVADAYEQPMLCPQLRHL